MGLFKKIKKIGKKVLKGAKKVFKKAKKFIGKIAGSKWGKALMIAGAVVMGGIAVYGAISGITSAAATAAQPMSFMAKFAAGAKGALGAVASPVATAKGALGGLTAPTAPGLASAANIASVVPPAAPAAAVPGAGGGAGFLSKAGTALGNFAKSAGGGQIISGAVQGFAEGKQAEEAAKAAEEARTWQSKGWENYGGPAPSGGGGGGPGPGSTPSRALPTQGVLSQARQRYAPSPREQVASYARGYA